MYSEVNLIRDVRAMKTDGKSLRRIADHYGPPIHHGDIARILRGDTPKSVDKRRALKLPEIIEVSVCPTCGAAPEYCGHCYTVTIVTPRRKPRYRDLFAMPVAELRRAVERREEW